MSLNHTLRRSGRRIKKSERAREADGPVPGIDSALGFAGDLPSQFGSEFTSDHAQLTQTFEPAQLKLARGATRNREQANQIPDVMNSSKSYHNQKMDVTTERSESRNAVIPTPPDTPHIKHKSKSSHVMPAMPLRTARNRVLVKHDFLKSIKLRIYDWPQQPTDFTKLCPQQRAFKAKQDEHDRDTDKDQELDDWYEKVGRQDAYRSAAALNYSIARTSILRAKRAYWAGHSWQSFEDEELSIDSQSYARSQTDADLRLILLEEAVDNNLRLVIFNSIKRRLCAEIWLQEYGESDRHNA